MNSITTITKYPIRPFEKKDAIGVTDLHNRSYSRHAPYIHGEFEDIPYAADVYDQSNEAFVVKPGVKDRHIEIVACGGIKRISDEIAEIVRMRVDPVVQNMGFGSEMLEHLETIAVAQGYTHARVTTVVEWIRKNEDGTRTIVPEVRSADFYENHGYQPETSFTVIENGSTKLVLEKRLVDK